MIPDDMMNKLGRQMAANIFGMKNIKNESVEMLSQNALALLCKDSKRESSFAGLNVTGFKFGFCKSAQTVQTDVGVCIGANNNQILLEGNVLLKEEPKKIKEGLKDVEHVMVIQVDKFGNLNGEDFKVDFVTIDILIVTKFILMILNRQCYQEQVITTSMFNYKSTKAKVSLRFCTA